MHKLMQFLAFGFVFVAVSNVGTLAQADHWYVPRDYPVPVYSQPIYSEPHYSQPIYGQPIYSRPAYVTSVTRSSVIIAQPVVVYSEPVYVEPVIVTHRVFVPSPIYAGPVVSAPYKVREEIKSRPGHYEYEQRGRFRVYNEGMRPKTYRYEYEVDQRYGRTKTKFDIRD